MDVDKDQFIAVVKLKSGVNLVSEVQDYSKHADEDSILLIKPMELHSYFDESEDTPKRIMFLDPWMPMGIVTDYDVVIHSEDYYVYTEVTKEFAQHYHQALADLKVADEKNEEKAKVEKISENVYSLGVKKKPSDQENKE